MGGKEKITPEQAKQNMLQSHGSVKNIRTQRQIEKDKLEANRAIAAQILKNKHK